MTTRPRGAQQRWRVLAASAIALGGVLVSPSQGDATVTAASGSAPSRVIVQTADGSLTSVVKAAEKLGAHVVSTQASLDTVVVDLPANHLDDLRDVPGVRAATRDMRVHLSSVPSVTGSSGDISNVAEETGATDYWDSGFFGQGVDVALLDSGVLPVDGLMTPNKLVIGPDLSFENRSKSLRGLDTFGHGTHMAGIIAGLRHRARARRAIRTPRNHFVGMAPASRIVSIKLADAHGQTDVSQVVAGIGWVVDHAHDPGLNIRVLNLSFGTDPSQGRPPRPAGARRRGRLGPRHRRRRVGRQRHHGGRRARQPGALHGRARCRQPGHPRHDATPTTTRSRPSPSGATPARASADRTSWRPGVSLVSLRAPGSYIDQTQQPGPGRRPVLQGQRHLAVGGCRLRRRGADAVAAPAALARPGP